MSSAVPVLVNIQLKLQDLAVHKSAQYGQTFGRGDLVEALAGGTQPRYLLAVSRQVFKIRGPCREGVVCEKLTPNMRCRILDAQGKFTPVETNVFQLKNGQTAAFSGFMSNLIDRDVMQIDFPDVELRNCFTVSLEFISLLASVKEEPDDEEGAEPSDDHEAEPEPVAVSGPVSVKCEKIDAEMEEAPAEAAVAKEVTPAAKEITPAATETEEVPRAAMVKAEPVYENVEPVVEALPVLVKSEECEVMDGEQSVQIHIGFPKFEFELPYDAVERGWDFGRARFSEVSLDRVKIQIPRQVFVIDYVEPGGQKIKIQMITPKLKCFLVPEGGQERTEVSDTFEVSRNEIVLFVNKEREDTEVLFTLRFSDDELNLISDEEEDIEEDKGDCEDEEDLEDANMNAYESCDFTDSEDEYVENDVAQAIGDMLDASVKGFRGAFDKDAEAEEVPKFSAIGKRVVQEAHRFFDVRADSVKLDLIGVPSDAVRKITLEKSCANIEDNKEWAKAPYSDFEEKTRELEDLYVINHILKHPDKSCYSYRVAKPDEVVLPKPAAKKARTIKPTVTPHGGEAI
jgi:hypothetical protein